MTYGNPTLTAEIAQFTGFEPLRLAATLVLATALAACGGGGGGAAEVVVAPAPVIKTTAVSGTVTPLIAPGAVSRLPFPVLAAASVRTDMLLPTNVGLESYAAILQSQHFQLEIAASPALKVESLVFNAADLASPLALSTGLLTYSGDPALGQLSQTTTAGPIGSSVSLLVSLSSSDTIGTLITATYCNFGNCGFYAFGIVLPFSATANPNGYTFQTFGGWALPYWPTGIAPIPGAIAENWFSVGIPTDPVTLPVIGTASYVGQGGGSFIDVPTRDPADIATTINATVNFATRTVAFNTTATSSLSFNAAAGVTPAANAVLNMNGTLAYVLGSNTFTGAVTTPNGMTGNATCRFYGPALGAPTANKALGAAPEIGCTFALSNTTVGAMYGALGAK